MVGGATILISMSSFSTPDKDLLTLVLCLNNYLLINVLICYSWRSQMSSELLLLNNGSAII